MMVDKLVSLAKVLLVIQDREDYLRKQLSEGYSTSGILYELMKIREALTRL